MPKLGAPLNFASLEAQNMVVHNLGGPPSGVKGQLYFDTGTNSLYYHNGSTWIAAGAGAGPADATTSTKGIVQLAGDLAGTAASPQIAAGVITDLDVNSANKDGVAGTASMRTLGAGAQQALAGNTRLDQLAAPTADVNLSTRHIYQLGDPINPQDAATKNYVDAFVQGLDVKASCKAATVVGGNITLSGTQNVDGVSLIVGDRCLVKNQTDNTQNGIYVVASGAWTRATDMDIWGEVSGAHTFIEQGAVNISTSWVCTSISGGTLGSTGIIWAQYSGIGTYTAGTGLTLVGSQFRVATDGITNAMIADGAINIASADVTGVLPLTSGGTGQTTTKAAREGMNAAGYYITGVHGAGTTISITQATHLLRASQGIFVQTVHAATGVVEWPDVTIGATGDVTIAYAVSQTANSKVITLIG